MMAGSPFSFLLFSKALWTFPIPVRRKSETFFCGKQMVCCLVCGKTDIKQYQWQFCSYIGRNIQNITGCFDYWCSRLHDFSVISVLLINTDGVEWEAEVCQQWTCFFLKRKYSNRSDTVDMYTTFKRDDGHVSYYDPHIYEWNYYPNIILLLSSLKLKQAVKK